MSLLNYSVPFAATPNPPAFYQPPPAVTFNPHPQGYQPPNYHQTYPNNQNNPYYNSYSQPRGAPPPQQQQHPPSQQQQQHPPPQQQVPRQQQQIPLQQQTTKFPENPPGYTRVDSRAPGGPNTKTQIHAVVDYDDDFGDYYDDDDGKNQPPVTPIQGPIFLKNGSVPVVPLYSYPVLNNGTFIQIPILWTALSVALGLEIRGEIIRGVPCIKRYHQLFCPTAGNSYPLSRIELFIDENKALMKRMYGDFQMGPDYGPGPGPGGGSSTGPGPGTGGRKAKREASAAAKGKPGVPDLHADPGIDPASHLNIGESYFSKLRKPRQSFRNNQSTESGRVDACESKTEIVTPYWASNSAGKIRAIVNTQHFEQAIHQEVCSKVRTNRCSGDCGCEQKYKWHRLLAYDPDNDCKGIFMDWFLFPSCCVCRCNAT